MFLCGTVVGTWNEPTPGWIDNLQTATGVIVGCGTGVLRTILCDKDVYADLVPVDMACNAMIAVAWDAANRSVHAFMFFLYFLLSFFLFSFIFFFRFLFPVVSLKPIHLFLFLLFTVVSVYRSPISFSSFLS